MMMITSWLVSEDSNAQSLKLHTNDVSWLVSLNNLRPVDPFVPNIFKKKFGFIIKCHKTKNLFSFYLHSLSVILGKSM